MGRASSRWELSRLANPRPKSARPATWSARPWSAGDYLEVVVEYDNENNVAHAYAIRCDREAPTRWE